MFVLLAAVTVVHELGAVGFAAIAGVPEVGAGAVEFQDVAELVMDVEEEGFVFGAPALEEFVHAVDVGEDFAADYHVGLAAAFLGAVQEGGVAVEEVFAAGVAGVEGG